MHRPGVELAIFRSPVRRPTTTLPRQPNHYIHDKQSQGRRSWGVPVSAAAKIRSRVSRNGRTPHGFEPNNFKRSKMIEICPKSHLHKPVSGKFSGAPTEEWHSPSPDPPLRFNTYRLHWECRGLYLTDRFPLATRHRL